MSNYLPSSRYFILIALSLAFLALADRARAGDELSLPSAVEEGLGRSPELAKYRAAKDEASYGKDLGESAFLPKLELDAEHVFSAQYETVPVTLGPLTAAVPIVAPRTSFGVNARWVLWNGLANVNGFEAASDLFAASEHEQDRKSFELSRQISLTFYEALAAVRFEEVAEENVKTLQENLAQVRLRLEGGRATEYDVLRVEVQLSDATAELEKTKDDVTIQRKRLTQVMGLSEDSRTLSGELPLPALTQEINTPKQPEPSSRDDIRAFELRSLAADKQAAAAQGFLSPEIGLSADYLRYENTDYPGEAYGGFRDAWSVGVFARWNILDGGASFARAGISRAQAAQAEYRHQAALLTIPVDFELWKRRYVYSAHHFEAKQQDVKRSEESFRISNLSYSQGRKTITDVLEAETDLFRARAGVVRSLLDAEEALIQLELTLGRKVGQS